MQISHETHEQTQQRLLQVIRAAEFVVHPGLYAYQEYPVTEFPTFAVAQAIAFVRDDEVWSVLAAAEPNTAQSFMLFSFHFKPGLDNSGFVGWLAAHVKEKFGSGILVVCGCNSSRGGIFDYWGAPAAVGQAVIAEIETLRAVDRDA